MLSILRDAIVLVVDGNRALIFRNDGSADRPHLRIDNALDAKTLPTRALGTDRPGRVAEHAIQGQRSALESTDWHKQQKRRFVRDAAAILELAVKSRSTPAITIVAPPRTLAELRNVLHTDTRKLVVAEINKDLTKHSIQEITAQLSSLD